MRKLFVQFLKFIGVSGIGWIIDMVLYVLLRIVSINLIINNFISSCAGVSFVFFFSTRFIFKVNTKLVLYLKYIIYLIYQIILIYIVSELLSYINNYVENILSILNLTTLSFIVSKMFVTPITMVLNFIMMKVLTKK